MIPSILTSQIRRGVEDFLQTTFPPSNRFFHGILDRLLAKEGARTLRQYAAQIFSEAFDEQSVITETLVRLAEFFGEISSVHSGIPDIEKADVLNADGYVAVTRAKRDVLITCHGKGSPFIP